MSAQTGIATPRGPASQRLGDRMRYRVHRWRSQPNPLWMREMRQSVRLVRTPIILMVLTVLITLIMASLGGLMTGTSSPAKAGTILFHTYFSVAFFVVTLLGPALAANSIASEREGHTWEAVLLTGIRPAEVARGKFMAAYTSIAVYVIMLAPVAALPFLFGGITPIEVLVAFLLLLLIALLGVAFGLAVSSKMTSLRGALLLTLLLSVPLSVLCYLLFGVALSVGAHELWSVIPKGPPVWLPTAYGRVPFSLEYLVYLVALPVAGITLPAWLLYEITHANLTSVTDDRSYGLKRWMIVSALVLATVSAVPLFAVQAADRAWGLIGGLTFYCAFVVFCAFLLAGEAIGPSRRVDQMLAKAGWWRRALGPGLMKASALQLVTALGPIAALCLLALGVLSRSHVPKATLQSQQVLLFSAYAAGFSIFILGVTALLRARSTSATVPRVLLLLALFFLTSGPWVVAAIGGLFTRGASPHSPAMAMAAPSPIYAFVAAAALEHPHSDTSTLAALIMAALYAGVGAWLMLAAGHRTRRIISAHRATLAEADRQLAEEDQQRDAAAASAAAAAAEGAAPAPPST